MKTSNIADFYNKGQELIKKNRLDDALNIFLELSKICFAVSFFLNFED